MANFELSDYQKRILDFVSNERGNLLVDAKAGSGKTTTLIMIANELSKKGNKCLFLSFNSDIVKDLRRKIPDEENCKVFTVHSLGRSSILSHLWRRYKENYTFDVKKDKLIKLVKDYYDKNFRKLLDFYNVRGTIDDSFVTSEMIEYNAPRLDERELKEVHNNIIRDFEELCKQCRNFNVDYRNDNYGMRELIKRFCHTLDNFVDDVFPDFLELTKSVIDKIKYDYENPPLGEDGKPHIDIDFNDMIYFPVYYKLPVASGTRPYLGTILVDEAQDLNILEQKYISLLNNNFNRFIFVGDERQSIYGFAGADTQAIKQLSNTFVLNYLPLNICYRCPENVVRVAKGIVPSIEWNSARDDKGNVEFVTMDYVVRNIRPGDVLVGRRNKDLVQIYRHFVLDLKRQIKFRNSTLVKSLVHDIESTVKKYIKRYSNGLNIEVPLYEHMEEWAKENGYKKTDSEYSAELTKYSRFLISENKAKTSRQVADTTSIKFLRTCMKEYKELGSYNFKDEEDVYMNEYYGVIEDFIGEFLMAKTDSKDINGFITYIRKFLSGSLDKDVPEISSVHAMKGGEADNIYIYNYPFFPYTYGKKMSKDDIMQEENIQYVAVTRAKKNLYLVKVDVKDEDGSYSEYVDSLNASAENRVEELLNFKF